MARTTLNSNVLLVQGKAGGVPFPTATYTDTNAVGSFTANAQSVAVNSAGAYTVIIQLLGTWVGTLAFEQTLDSGATWSAVQGVPPNGGAVVTGATANGQWVINSGGFQQIRVRSTAWTSGTATVVLNASLAQNSIGADVYGGAATGTAPLRPPVLVSGVDGGGLKRTVLTGTDGALAFAFGAGQGVSIVSSTAQETSRVLKASAGSLVALTVYNGKATAQFIQIFNSTTVPADTAVPVYSVTVPGLSNFVFDFQSAGAPFTTGISISNSSTQPTKTIGSADCFFTAIIK